MDPLLKEIDNVIQLAKSKAAISKNPYNYQQTKQMLDELKKSIKKKLSIKKLSNKIQFL